MSELPEGLRIYPPKENAPDFVKGDIVITLENFRAWIRSQSEHYTEYDGKKQLRLQLLESKEGRLYFKLNNYKREDKQQSDDDLPF